MNPLPAFLWEKQSKQTKVLSLSQPLRCGSLIAPMADADPPKPVTKIEKVGNFSDQISKLVTLVSLVVAAGTSILWFHSDSEKKELDNKLGRLTIKQTQNELNAEAEKRALETRISQLQIAKDQVELAKNEPQFTAQYVLVGGAVFADMLGGAKGSRLANKLVTLKKQVTGRKFASDVLDRFFGFPVLDTHLPDRYTYDRLKAFLSRNTDVASFSELVAHGWSVLSVAVYGASAKNVRIAFERREVKNADFFLSSLTTYGQNPATIHDEAPVEGGKLSYSSEPFILPVGDLLPSTGLNIPIRHYLQVEDAMDKQGNNTNAPSVVFEGVFLVPTEVQYTNLLGKTVSVPIRPPLDYPMPVCDYIDVAG